MIYALLSCLLIALVVIHGDLLRGPLNELVGFRNFFNCGELLFHVTSCNSVYAVTDSKELAFLLRRVVALGLRTIVFNLSLDRLPERLFVLVVVRYNSRAVSSQDLVLDFLGLSFATKAIDPAINC